MLLGRVPDGGQRGSGQDSWFLQCRLSRTPQMHVCRIEMPVMPSLQEEASLLQSELQQCFLV